MTQNQPRLFSGMQPTSGSLHLGNYLGALRNWVQLQDEFQAIYSVVNLHTLTVDPNPEELEHSTRLVAAQYIAAGVDPEKAILFVQSDVPGHSRLAWILGCYTGFGEAGRMTQFKDKSQTRGSSATNVGLFTYPILMAADILLYDAKVVPVGEDQRQHLELTRDLAQRMNSKFGDLFVVPEPYILKETAKIFDLVDPSAKMSKSGQSPAGLIGLLDEPKVVAKRIKSATTDSGTEVTFDPENKAGVSNLLTIHSALSGTSIGDLEREFEGKMYGHLKVAVADLVVDFITPYQQRVAELMDDRGELDRILAVGAQKASEIAEAKMRLVHERLGMNFTL